MKRIITYVAAVTALVLAVSCSRESIQDTLASGDGLSLQVTWTDMATRADEGEVNNEYAVNSLDWYFYKDTTAAPAFHYREAIAAGDAKALKYIRDFVPGQTYGGAAFPHRADLCGADDCCTVFVVANLPSSKVQANATLTALKAIEVDQTFLDGESPLAPDAAALNFIMTGQAQVKGTTKTVAEATPEVIEMSRLAVKITYSVTLKSRVTTANGITETWTPMLKGNNVRMYPQNVVTNALLGAVDKKYPASLTTIDQMAAVVVSSDTPSKWEESGNNFTTKKPLGPYYTYPNNWEKGGADTFVKIIVPWQVVRKDADGNVTYSAQREVYYKVLLPDPMTLSNHWYQLTINLAPGTENEPEVEVEAQYKVAKWIGGGEEGVDGYLKDIKFLIADRSDEVSVDGDSHFVTYTRGISIPYSASNPVIFEVVEASYVDFYTEKPTVKKFVENHAFSTPTGTSKIVGTTTDGNNWSRVQDLATVESWFKFDNGSTVGAPEGSLVMNHWLNGNLTSDYFDVSPYTFKVRIYLQRDPEHYVEELTIVQYPQTYIDAQESTVKSGTVSKTTPFIGYIFVNGVERTSTTAATNDGRPTPWTNITGLGSMYQNKTNHNMYILTTSVLSEADKRLGDPREEKSYNAPKRVGNLVNGVADGGDKTENFITAPAVGGGTKTLTNYYPTDPAKSPTFIAPKLRISSAFGRRGSNNGGDNTHRTDNANDDYRYNYASAWNRCAAYQEDGYPAGRWRLPTEAEIEYINALSQREFIPSLFYGSTPYWTATPGRSVAEGKFVDTYLSASTRCVYDDWYWGSKPVDGAQNKFMWGD